MSMHAIESLVEYSVIIILITYGFIMNVIGYCTR